MTLARVIALLVVIESGGNNLAVGDNGQAIGCLQLHECYVADVNRIYGTHYEWPRDAYSRAHSVRITALYLMHYGAASRLGRAPTFEDLARIHNGGPNGWRRSSTIAYWQRALRRWHGRG